jgi:plastocyanin
MRIMNKLSLLGVAALLAACGGGDNGGQTADNSGAAAPAAEAPAAEAPATPPAAPASGNVVEVRMVTTQNGASGVFEPANVTVKKGDTVRFIAADNLAAHNVSFPPAENAGKSNLPGPSPYITTTGATYDVPVTMDAGTYNFQCDPHAAMGMKGVLTVQ